LKTLDVKGGKRTSVVKETKVKIKRQNLAILRKSSKKREKIGKDRCRLKKSRTGDSEQFPMEEAGKKRQLRKGKATREVKRRGRGLKEVPFEKNKTSLLRQGGRQEFEEERRITAAAGGI